MLAYQYLTAGFPDAAIRQLKNVVALQPRDRLSAALLEQLQQKEQPAAGGDLGRATSGGGGAATPAAPELTSAKQGNLMGIWTAQPAADTTITLIFQDKGHFVWKVSRQGKDQQFDGTSTYDSGILTMVQQQDNKNVMVGNVAWKDDDHFTFKVLGGGPNDPGLSFTKSP